MGDWDEAVLRDEIAGLLAEDFDLSLLGITDEDLDALLQDPDIGDGAIEGEDDTPEIPEDPVSRAGDLWVLGNHRLLCGDATVSSDVARVLGTVKPLLMVTDPPYGVEYDPGWRNQAGTKTKRTGNLGRKAKGHRQLVADVAVAFSRGGHISGDHQQRVARRLGPGHQTFGHIRVARDIKLEPAVAIRRLGQRLQRRRGGRRGGVRDVLCLAKPRQHQARTGPEGVEHAARGHPERRVKASAKDRHACVDLAGVSSAKAVARTGKRSPHWRAGPRSTCMKPERG